MMIMALLHIHNNSNYVDAVCDSFVTSLKTYCRKPLYKMCVVLNKLCTNQALFHSLLLVQMVSCIHHLTTNSKVFTWCASCNIRRELLSVLLPQQIVVDM